MRRIIAFFMAVLICCSQVVETTSAIVSDTFYDENFYSLNSIGWYDPRCAETTSARYTQLAGNDNTEKILNFFMRKGLSLAQAAGIIGNMIQESKLNPAVREGGRSVDDSYVLEPNVGFGLVQWTEPGRQLKFMAHMKELGVGITDLSGQLEFVWKELNGQYAHSLRALRATQTPVEAAIAVHGPPTPGHEASNDSPEKVRTVRGGAAQAVYEKYADAPALAGSTADSAMLPAGEGSEIDIQTAAASTGSSSSCVSQSSSGASGSFADLVKQYAWQDFVAPGTSKSIEGKNVTATTQRPEYTAAIATARRELRYIGGANGNDCGGFVTTLIYDSGYDKKYNSNAKGGNTLSQERWLQQNWQRLSAEEEKDASKRQPGDVAINEDHTYIYVGDVPGFNSKIASASYSDRAPMAGKEGVVDSTFRWYRKK